MRVALVIERYQRGAGGVERDAVELVDAFCRRGVPITVVCRRAEIVPPAPASLEIVGGPSFWQPLRVLAFSSRAAAATRERFDLVHTYSRTRHQDVYRAGGGSHAEFMERFYSRPRLQRWSPRHAAILAIEEAVFRDETQLVQTLTERDAHDISRRYGVAPERLTVTRPGVDTQRFSPASRAAYASAIRQELSLDGPVALFVGSGFARKGLDRAISGLAASGAKATLLVAGAGEHAAFERQARALGVAERVRFLGVRNDVERLHAASDLVVLPTRYDAFGNAVLEAMASGVAVATTPMAGAAELLEPGLSGFVLEEDFAPAFAALDTPERLQAMGTAGRRVAETLTWDRHAERVLQMYESLRR